MRPLLYGSSTMTARRLQAVPHVEHFTGKLVLCTSGMGLKLAGSSTAYWSRLATDQQVSPLQTPVVSDHRSFA